MIFSEEEEVATMQCYTELLPPSGVTHSAALAFLSSKASNLVIAKTNLLQVFKLRTIGQTSRDEPTPHSKLVLVSEYPLCGTVTSLQPVTDIKTKSGGAALLIAFKDAKLSLLEWDVDNHRISTISIHYYEGDHVIGEPFGPSLNESESILTVDPRSRCAALKFGSRQLAILPFRPVGEDLMEGVEGGFDSEADVPSPDAPLKRTSTMEEVVADGEKETPYTSSFVMPMTALLPDLTHPVDLAFLYASREPTFGILSATKQPSAALLEERKDILSFHVVSLDPEPREITYLGSAQKLPSDLWKVVPLPAPIGGALLVGTNELVYADQAASKISAVAVNEFAKVSSDLSMEDQSDLNLKLEGCEVQSLDQKTGDLLLVLSDSSLAILSFKLLGGRNVGGLRVTPVSGVEVDRLVAAAPSCTARLSRDVVFLGSEDGDSTLLSWSKPTTGLSRKRSHAQMLGKDTTSEDDEEAEDLDEDDDDLYTTTADAGKRMSSNTALATAADVYTFHLQDRLPALGPINSTCLGQSPLTKDDHLELVAGVGRGRGSRLAVMSKDIVPVMAQSGPFPDCTNAWSLSVAAEDEEVQSEERFDTLLFCYDGTGTRVYDVDSNADGESSHEVAVRYVERSGTDFEYDGETMEVATIAKGTRIVQCKRDQIRTYQSTDLSLVQIVPMMDDETDKELSIVHMSISDPYIFVLRDDSSILVLQVGDDGEVEPLDSSDAVMERRWHSGCLYNGVLCPGETIICLLGEEGGLHMFGLPDLQPFYTAPTLSSLPAVLSTDPLQRRTGGKETLAELLFTDVGTEDVKQTVLILRSATDDLTFYEPWSPEEMEWQTKLRFRKIPVDYLPKFDEGSTEANDGRPAALKPVRIGAYSAVLVPGASPSLVIKQASSLPKVIGLRARHVKALLPVHRASARRGFGLLFDGTLQECTLPSRADFSTGWCVEKLALGDTIEEVRHIAYHHERQMYVVTTCKEVDFYFPSEDSRSHETECKSFFLYCTCTHHEHIRPLLSSSVERRL